MLADHQDSSGVKIMRKLGRARIEGKHKEGGRVNWRKLPSGVRQM